MKIFNCVAARLMQVEAIAFKQSPCLSLHRMQHLGIQDRVEVDLRREIYELQKALREKDQEYFKCKMSKTRYKNAYKCFCWILDEMKAITHLYEDEEEVDLLRAKVQEFAKLKPQFSKRYFEPY